MLVNRDITSSEYERAKAQRNLGLKAGRRFIRIREPYFFSYVQELLQQEYGSNTVREGGLRVYTTIKPWPAEGGDGRGLARVDRAD